jgi:hypothetical protein
MPYRPIDLTSYEFGAYPLINPTITQNVPMMLIGGTGWNAGAFTIEYNAIVHLETIGGLLQSAADDRQGVGSSDEALRASAKAGDPTKIVNGLNFNAGHAEKLHAAYRMAKSSAQFSQQLSNMMGGGHTGGIMGAINTFNGFMRATAPDEEKKDESVDNPSGSCETTGDHTVIAYRKKWEKEQQTSEDQALPDNSFEDLGALDLDSLPRDELLVLLKKQQASRRNSESVSAKPTTKPPGGWF